MAALALFVQVLIQPGVAHAATSFSISPDSLQGWQVSDDSANGGTTHFVNTPGGGSVQFNLSSATQAQSLSAANYGATKLADISALAYDTYTHASTSIAPSFRLTIDMDITDANTDPQGYLVYSPYQNGQVIEGQWQHHDARAGLWWSSEPGVFNALCSQVNPCSLNTIITLYPDAGIIASGGIGFAVANETEPSVSDIDGLVFNDDMYNFEAISAPQLLSPANEGVSAPTLVNSWQGVSTASAYIYESYSDAEMTQLRASDVVTDTQKTESGLASGSTIWWRVKSVDTHGNEGNWSELRKVTIATSEEEVPVTGTGVESGSSGGGQTDVLFEQLARLSEPLEMPNTVSALYPQSAIESGVTSSDKALLNHAVIDRPSTDGGVEPAAVAVPTESGWKFFGVLWYWWVVPVGMLVAVVARTIRLLRESRTFLYSSNQI